jgi:uncharacterized repeat protein (TIGR01451 family)
LVVPVALVSVPAFGWAQTVIYSENFENAITNTATGAEGYSVAGASYVGTTPAGQSYTASSDWLNGNHCNGIVLSASNSTVPSWANSQTACRPDSGAQSYNAIRTIARGMGQAFGGGDNDHVVSAYSECANGVCSTIGSGPTNGIMFKTNNLIPVTANHFYTFAVQVAALNCPAVAVATPGAGDPQYQFQLVDGTGTTTNVGGVLDACTTGRTANTVANLQTSPFASSVTVYTKAVTASAAFQYTGSSLGVQMYNANGATFGNDGAFDNIQVVDVTPTLSKSFSPASLPQGGTSTLTFTVTNTGDLLAKAGWTFTDSLSSGLVVASPNGLGGTCISAGATVTATAGTSTITLTNGNLAAGTASCTITVNVTSASAATYTNGAANVTASFVNPPPNASVTFLPKVNVSVSKDDGRTSYSPGGSGIYTITVNNTGPGTATGLALGDVLPLGVTLNGTWTCAGAGGSSCSAANGTTAAALNALLLTMPPGTAPPGSSTAVVIQVPVTYSNSPASY